MRDAFGGAFMIRVLIVFLFVFITFVAVAFNYARAFRIKNQVIDIIEQYEGIADYSNKSEDSVIGKIEKLMREKSYAQHIDISDYCPTSTYEVVDNDYGYCIGEYVSENSSRGIFGENVQTTYYRVQTFVVLKFPIFDNFRIIIPVKGETRKIERIVT